MIVRAETVFTDASGSGPCGYLVRPDDAAHGSYNEAAARDAWQAALDFFKRNLA